MMLQILYLNILLKQFTNFVVKNHLYLISIKILLIKEKEILIFYKSILKEFFKNKRKYLMIINKKNTLI